MARITIDDCLQKIPNRFELVAIAAKRAKQLFRGAKPLLQTENRGIVTTQREIAGGTVRQAQNNAQLYEETW